MIDRDSAASPAGLAADPAEPPPVLYPFKFSTLREGDKDPTLNKSITWLIDSDDDFIVYIDDDYYVEWSMNSNEMLGPDTGQYLNQVARLEAVDTSHLLDGRKQSYARMIGEGVARLFQKNLEAAEAAFNLAEEWITARNTEVARRWYLVGSGATALVSAVAVLILGFWINPLQTRLDVPTYNILMGTSMGGLGAWLSVIQRSRKTELDVAAGPTLHYLEGAFRIIAGMLGAMLIALAIRAKLILQVDQLSAVMVMCLGAGASERLVPSFIEQIESRTSGPNGKPPE
jgi:hypothetical protein